MSQKTPLLYKIFQSGFTPFPSRYAYMMAKDGKAVGNMLTSDVAKLTAASFFEMVRAWTSC